MTTSLKPFGSRQASLQNRITLLNRRLEKLDTANQRYILARLVVFLGGVAFIALSWWLSTPSTRCLAFILSLVAFLGVVFFHRRFTGWVRRLQILRELYQVQLARLTLDWVHIPRPSSAQADSERVPLDIDLDLTGPRSLHHLIDLAVSQEGSGRLADWLTNPTPDPSRIAERQAVVRELAKMPRFCSRLQLSLRQISSDQLHGERLLAWMNDYLDPGPLGWLLVIAGLITTTNAVLFILYLMGELPAYWIPGLLVYLAFIGLTWPKVGKFLTAIVSLNAELDKFTVLLRFLERYPIGNRPNLEKYCAPFRQPGNLPSLHLRRVRYVTAGVGVISNPILALMVNLVLPWNFAMAFFSSRLLPRIAPLFRTWLEAWYSLEALTSLGNFSSLHPDFAFPEITPQAQPALQAIELGHPLIRDDRRAGNDFSLLSLGEVLIITGSNMAGKSTFIKTVGINLVLANAGGPVCAASFRALPFRLHSCIHITDSIIDGFSYFYAEVKCLRTLLDRLTGQEPFPLLYLIDEIFRGTNNRERLLGSQAFTKALIGAHGTGLIATHDLELARLSERDGRVLNFHFDDEVKGGRLIFDYRLRPGTSPTTNALKIMELEGLPIDP